MRVLHFVFDQRPQLLEKSAQVFRFFLRLLQFLVEEFFAVPQKADQLFVLLLQHFDLFKVLALASVATATPPIVRRALRLHLLHHVLASVMVLATLLRGSLRVAHDPSCLTGLLHEGG